MNSEIRDNSKKDSFIERAENLKKTLADSNERELQDIARIKNKWENGLTEEEKENLKRLSQEITKDDAEKEMKESYEILRKFFYEEPVDNYIYWLKLDIMLDIKYGCSLYENFDENIKNNYFDLMNKIRRAIEFGEKYDINTKDCIPSLDELFAGDVNGSINNSEKQNDIFQNEIDENIKKKISEKEMEMEAIRQDMLNSLNGIDIDSEKGKAIYAEHEEKTRKIESEIERLYDEGFNIKLKKEQQEEDIVMKKNQELKNEHYKVYCEAMWKYVEGQDISGEIEKMKKLKEEIEETVEEYKAIGRKYGRKTFAEIEKETEDFKNKHNL